MGNGVQSFDRFGTDGSYGGISEIFAPAAAIVATSECLGWLNWLGIWHTKDIVLCWWAFLMKGGISGICIGCEPVLLELDDCELVVGERFFFDKHVAA